MEKIDMVLVGAEGVAESGGIINKVGQLIPLDYYKSQINQHYFWLRYAKYTILLTLIFVYFCNEVPVNWISVLGV